MKSVPARRVVLSVKSPAFVRGRRSSLVRDFTLKTTRRAGTLFIDIQSKTLLKDAYIDLGETGWQLSDNFLDILPGRRYRLRATRRQNAPARTTTALPTVTLRSITTAE